MDKSYITPIVSAKAAEDHILKIKSDHADLLAGMQNQRERVMNENSYKEQKLGEQKVQNQAISDKQQADKLTQDMKNREIMNKEKELQIKMAALSAE